MALEALKNLLASQSNLQNVLGGYTTPVSEVDLAEERERLNKQYAPAQANVQVDPYTGAYNDWRDAPLPVAMLAAEDYLNRNYGNPANALSTMQGMDKANSYAAMSNPAMTDIIKARMDAGEDFNSARAGALVDILSGTGRTRPALTTGMDWYTQAADKRAARDMAVAAATDSPYQASEGPFGYVPYGVDYAAPTSDGGLQIGYNGGYLSTPKDNFLSVMAAADPTYFANYAKGIDAGRAIVGDPGMSEPDHVKDLINLATLTEKLNGKSTDPLDAVAKMANIRKTEAQIEQAQQYIKYLQAKQQLEASGGNLLNYGGNLTGGLPVEELP